jgi:hypothetical protein
MKIHERGGICFMANSWFAPPIGWTYIGLWLQRNLSVNAISDITTAIWDAGAEY